MTRRSSYDSSRLRTLGGKLVALVLATSFATGCAAQQQLYYWGPYQGALHAQLVAGDPEAATSLLEAAVQQSSQQALPLGPGVRAELGYLRFLQGRNTEAISLFRAEAGAFPESAFLMTKLATEIERLDAGPRQAPAESR